MNSNINAIYEPKNEHLLKEFLIAIYSCGRYTTSTQYIPKKIQYDFDNIRKRFLKKMTYSYKERVDQVYKAIYLNQQFLNELVRIYRPSEEICNRIPESSIDFYYVEDKINWELFYYIMRDWTDEREADRKRQYEPILAQVKQYLNQTKDSKCKVLVPGAGLCRLAYDIVNLGHDVICNDFSYLNYIVTDYLLTKSRKYQFSIKPHVISFSDFLTEAAAFEEYKFPNIDTGLGKEGQGKLIYDIGDFTKKYNDKSDYFDCVVTVYFIDSARNIIEYIDIIHRILKKGGVWINYGPPTYDWQRPPIDVLIYLPWDKQKEVINNYGFEIVKEEKIFNAYCYNKNKTMNTKNLCIFFTAMKK